MTILDEIIAQKRIEVAQRKAATPVAMLEQMPDFKRQALSSRDAIQDLRSTGIIAEFKRKSPSKGIINDQVGVAETTQGYVRAGAAVLSILTDEPFFGGTPADLQAARLANPETPILRKDFVIDYYQLLEAKAWGADLILLIAACLTPAEVIELSQQAHDLSMQVLLEVHDQDELDRSLTHTVDLVGVNNRDLKTFTTSIDTSLRLIEHIPDTFVKITESGLHNAATMYALFQAGYDGFLIGEAFMKTADPAEALQALVTDFTSQMPTFTNSLCHEIKVCGLRDAENLKEIAALHPDFVGFIFYDQSPRFVGEELDEETVKALPRSIRKVGVFVNASPDLILRSVKKYDFQYVQLHGNETPEYCRSLRNRGINIIKAFRVDESFNFSMLNNFKAQCDFFLFDAKGDQPGGNGHTFDWSILSRYDNEKPFFISGGIGLDNLGQLAALKDMKLYGVDVNSQVETAPGVKDVAKVKELITRLRPVRGRRNGIELSIVKIGIFGGMNEPAYPFRVSNDGLHYDFESISEQRTIAKIIQFKPFPDNVLMYNLALGDLLPDGSFDDSTVSNNQDMSRVMATVFQAILSFFETYPSKLIYLQGSDEAGIRTRLYRVLITRELDKATKLFTIYGRDEDDSIEEFMPNRNYVGYIFQRKPN